MALSKKKVKIDVSQEATLLRESSPSDTDCNGGDSSRSNSGSESESSVDSQMEIEVEFEARNIEENDFHGIKRLLQQVFLKAKINLSDLTNLIIAQSSHFGSTVKVSSEEEDGKEVEEGEVYGVTSFIHLNHDHCCVDQVKKHLLSQCKIHGNSHFQQLSSVFHDASKPVGLLINERFLNIPAQIGSLVLRSLLKELSDAPSSVESCELVAVVARSHLGPTAGTGQKRKTKGGGGSGGVNEHYVFDYQENEFLLEECLFSFSYPVSVESDDVFGGKWTFDDVAMKPCRTIIILPYIRLEYAITALEKTLQ